MKKSTVVLSLVILGFAVAQNAMAQESANQNLNLAVNAVCKIVVGGNPGNVTISPGTAGTDALTTVSDPLTSSSITQNCASTAKVAANLDAAMSAAYTLQLNLASAKGTSAGTVDISGTTPASASDVVTNLGLGADANQAITCTFGANASTSLLASTAKGVTLNLAN